jgi:tRNA1Val (adenine37-N6)-methyltransferase
LSNTYFHFKQFTVRHDKCAMKVTTDAVLLGAWANTMAIDRVLDAGTGSGILALMVAQRTEALTDAVEIDQEAYQQACDNVKQSPWKERITVYHDSFQHFATASEASYDLIVTNPPYFKNALQSPDIRKTRARHTSGWSFEELLKGSSSLLKDNGRLALILPAAEEENFTGLAHIYRLYCHRICKVSTTPGTPVSRVLMEFSKVMTWHPEANRIVIYKAKGLYSDDYINLTRDFYLYMK